MSERPNHRQGRHAAPRVHGKHRATEPEAAADSPTNILPLTASLPVLGERRLALSSERKQVELPDEVHVRSVGSRVGAAVATTGLIFIGSMGAVGAQAVGSQAGESEATDTGSMLVLEEPAKDVTASVKAELKAPRVDVKTKPAPPKPKPVVKKVIPTPPPAPRVVEAPQSVAAPAAPPVVAVAPTPAPAPAPAPRPVAGTKAGAIAAAALAQLGRFQDCTMLVTNSLAAVGINFHDWPAGYLSLGSVVPAAAAVPGDLIYYANGGMGLAHIAVYTGNGVAVHGGWNGNQTVTFSSNVGSGPVFIRVA